MLITELSRATGFSVDTIRYYEKLGIIEAPIRRENGYRDYPPITVACLKLCRKAKDLGFTLEEIRSLGRLLDSRSLKRSDVKKHLHAKVADIDARISKLRALRRDLGRVLRSDNVFAT